MALLRVPRLGERPGSKGNSARLLAHARLAAAAGGVVLAFLVEPLLALVDAPGLLALLALGLAATCAAVAVAATRAPGEPALAAAAASAGVGATLLLGAASFAAFPRLAEGMPLDLLTGWMGGIAAAIVVGLLAILALAATGLAVEAARLELDTAGNRGVPLWLPLRAETAADCLAPAPRSAWVLGTARVLGVGFASPGLFVAEAAREAMALVARVRGRRVGAVHARFAAAELVALADALGDGIRVTTRPVLLPPAAHPWTVVAEGPPGTPEKLARLLEERHLSGSFAWSREAARLERRLGSLAAEAETAVTLEERAALLEDAVALTAIIAARDLVEEERTLLLGWKAQALQLRLRARLDEGAAGKGAAGLVAPGAALAPDLAALVNAGGLANASDVVYAPRWILPVATPAGETEIVVDGTTRSVEAAGDLLHVLAERGPRLLLPAAGRFIPPGRAEDAADEAARALAERGLVPRADGAYVVYVPYLATTDGSVDLLTGAAAGALPALPKGALPEGTLAS